MRVAHHSIWFHSTLFRVICLFVSFLVIGASCMRPETDPSLLGQADSLNFKAYYNRFRNPAEADSMAKCAMAMAPGNDEVAAFSQLVMAYHAFSYMDYDGADSLYSQIRQLTKNELVRLAADVGLMRVFHLTARGKDFYDHRENALNRLRRIKDEIDILDASDINLLVAVETEFHMVMATYYCYFGQHDKALMEMESIDEVFLEQNLPELRAYCLHLRGAEALCADRNSSEDALQRFDYLSRAFLSARRSGNELLLASTLQSMASLMLERDNSDTIFARRTVTLHRISGDSVQSPQSLPMDLADKAVQIHLRQDNHSLLINSYSVLAACLIDAQRYAEAVDTLSKALDIIVDHHRKYYTCNDSLHHLPTYNPEYMPVEIEWTKASTTQTVPEWILNIREQLSLAYAGMDMKVQSDYNRNIYLDLLEIVRQDKELENRYETLQSEEQSVRIVLWTAVAILLFILFLFFAIALRQRRLHSSQIRELEEILWMCRHKLVLDNGPSGNGSEAGGQPLSASSYEQAGNLLKPYDSWILHHEAWQNNMEEERLTVEEQHALHFHRMQTNKRENIMKRASLSLVQGIIPLIDRLMHEGVRIKDMGVGGIPPTERKRVYTYMRELTQEISVANELVTKLIQLKRGNISLHVETFHLAELMDIIAKGRTSFERKGITLTVVPTTCVIKADKALTLFMMNTLLDNARKYTPSGGHVRIEALQSGKDVEIVVSDTGPGIPEKDIQVILNEKYYNSQLIGCSGQSYETVSKQKGSGFGLMNCKGIIEKYRKYSPLFERVAFNISNRPEGGLSVSFVLPQAGEGKSSRASKIPVLLFLLGMVTPPVSATESSVQADSLLEKASYYADQAYYSNVDRMYGRAVSYIDSSFTCLNSHYMLTADSPDTTRTLSLWDNAGVNELEWLLADFVTDYHILLDLRNEAAVSFLGLHQWDDYRYNNQIYTDLYKQLSRDTSLDAYCVRLNRSSSAKSMAVFFIILLILGCLVVGYLLYMRGWMAYKFHLRQMAEVNRHLYNLFPCSMTESSDTGKIISASQILSAVWEGVSDIFSLRSMALVIHADEGNVSSCAFYPDETAETYRMKAYIDSCLPVGFPSSGSVPDIRWENGCLLMPLYLQKAGECENLGVLALVPENGHLEEEGLLMAQMLQVFMSSFVYHAVLKPFRHQEYTARAMDDANRNRHEEMRLYVQNTVLDNCLSTIKHETMFYPTRIAQILDGLLASEKLTNEEGAIVELAELIAYYREVYVLLATYASRQTDEVAFHRTTYPVNDLLQYATAYFQTRKQSHVRLYPDGKSPVLHVEMQADADLFMSGDSITLCYLVANLIDEAFSYRHEGHLYLRAFEKEGFVRFEFSDERRSLDVHTLNNLFSLEHLKNHSSDSGETVSGMEFLICRQIIREHDEYMGHPGCRINAEPAEGGKGYTVWFTIPKGIKR